MYTRSTIYIFNSSSRDRSIASSLRTELSARNSRGKSEPTCFVLLLTDKQKRKKQERPLTTSFRHVRSPFFPAEEAEAAPAEAVAAAAVVVVLDRFVFLLLAPGEARDRCLTRTRQLIPGTNTPPHLPHMEPAMQSGRPLHPAMTATTVFVRS